MFDSQQKFIDKNQASTNFPTLRRGQVRDIPERLEQLFQKQPIGKVSKLKEFFKSFLSLIHDKYVVVELTTLVEETQDEMRPDIRVCHVGKILKTGRGLRMTVQIGDYDMDYIILDLGSYVIILTTQAWESMGKLIEYHIYWLIESGTY